MAYREVRVFEVREVLRLWVRGESLRSVERLAGVDRKTVRRYVKAAEGLGVRRDGGEDQLSDEFIGSVVEAVRPRHMPTAARIIPTEGASAPQRTDGELQQPAPAQVSAGFGRLIAR